MYIFAKGKTNLKNTKNMKKSLLTIIICAATMGVGYAQYAEGTALQPTSVVAKRYDASGQLIKEMTSTYLYAEDGTLTDYDFPDHGLSSTYSYTDDVLVQEYTYHHGGHPYYDESFNYSYENCKLKNKTHLWDQMNASEYWLYSYNDEGQLERMDYKIEYSDDYHDHYLYEYEDGGRTKIESYWTSWVTQGLLLRKQTVYHYDEAFKLLTEQDDAEDLQLHPEREGRNGGHPDAHGRRVGQYQHRQVRLRWQRLGDRATGGRVVGRKRRLDSHKQDLV